jgi:serine phosphatase RsbU (regulator of sigma subunit)
MRHGDVAATEAGGGWLPVSRGTAGSVDDTIELLLVEDDDGDALLVRELLAEPSSSVEVSWVRTLADARPAATVADCVLLDLDLPDASGLDGLRRIRETAARVPVIVLTGHDDESVGEAAVAAGAQDYLIKGQVTDRLLIRTIRYAVQRRRAELMENALLEERLRVAENGRLERGLLPHPVLGGADLRVTARYRAGGGRMLLGGDFYDVVTDPAGRIHAIVGDVAGHGPDQAAVGVALRIAWRALVLAGRPDDEVLAVLDRVLVHERYEPGLFATVCTLAIEPGYRHGWLGVAGHPSPLLHHAGAWSPLPPATGPSLGLLDGARWVPRPVDLPEPPWRLLLYTDGAIEGYDGPGDDRLGTDGLLRILREHGARMPEPGPRTAAELDAVITEITRRNDGPLTDDMALLLLATPDALA